MKTLAELQTEIELGMIVYPSTNHDVDVRYIDGWYIFSRSFATPDELPVLHGERVLIGWNGHAYEPLDEADPTSGYPGGIMYDDGYKTFETLLTDWPSIVSQPVWSTAKTPERIALDEKERCKRMAQSNDTERKFSTPCKLSELEEVINTRTPVWDIAGSGDVRIKLDTDVNGHEWYVLSNDSNQGEYFAGMVYCWAFPHFNGSHDQYSYVPLKFCFNTLALLLEAYPTQRPIWSYDLEEYARRIAYNISSGNDLLGGF